jgi:hypothetical protein
MPLSHKCSNKASMEKITSTTELHALIFSLKQKQTDEELLLKEELCTLAQGLKPGNIIKSTFLDLSKSTDMKDSLINSSLSMAAGYVSKRLLVGQHASPFTKGLGMLVQIGISTIISKNSEKIKSGLAHIVTLFSNKKESAD